MPAPDRRLSVTRSHALRSALLCLAFGCAEVGSEVTVAPGPDAQTRIQTALIEADRGDVVKLGPGRYRLTRRLVIDRSLTLRGAGMRETILDFSQVASGSGDGILVTGDGVRIEQLGIEQTPGDAIRMQQARDLAVRSIWIDWPGEPGPGNGAYGLYPVQCEDVLLEDNQIRGAADAGIYVGQSRRVLVRRNRVTESVSGIEIENSVDVEARDNELTNNAAGLLAFALPELDHKTSRRIRIADNDISDNNGPNFARPGALVAAIPSGTGIVVMAADEVEVTENRVSGNRTANLAIYSYAVLQREYEDPAYDPFAEGIWIHRNRFSGGGDDPQGALAAGLRELVGLPFPDIVFDGIVDPGKLVRGALPRERRLYIENNGAADFVNLHLGGLLEGGPPRISRDLSAYRGTPPRVSRPAHPGES